MIKFIFHVIICSLVLTSCNGQTKSDTLVKNKDTIKPKVNIKVYKEYDEKGNLISIDSTYTYFYSNIKNDSILEKEIFNNFRLDLNNQFKPFDSLFMKDFFQDSPFRIPDFYTDDFFQNNYKSHKKRIENIFKEMDSLKNRYYLKQKEIFENNAE